MTKLFEPVMSRLKGWGFVLPALLWTAAFFAVPLIVMVCHSVWRFVDGRTVSDWTIANYESFFARNYLIDALTNSLEVAVITTVLSVVLAYPLAYILAYRVSRHWQWLALLLTILPFWTSYLVRSYSWLLVLSERGFVNSTLLALTFVNEPLSMAHNRGATILGLTHFFTMLLTLTIFANPRTDQIKLSRGCSGSWGVAAPDVPACHPAPQHSWRRGRRIPHIRRRNRRLHYAHNPGRRQGTAPPSSDHVADRSARKLPYGFRA